MKIHRKWSVYSNFLNIMQDKIKTKKIANTFLEIDAKLKNLGTTLINLQYFMKKLREHWTQVTPDSNGTSFFLSGIQRYEN